MPPRSAPYSQNPAAVLDFRRFTSDATLELLVIERDAIRGALATQPITTNFIGPFHALDYWRWADELDLIADDSYPDPADPQSFRRAAFTRDLMRSLDGGKPWMLMEQATNAVNWRRANAAKAPGQMAALSMQAVTRGATGVMFFQWRQSRSGSEKFHSAMLPHAGTETRTWQEVVRLGAELPTYDLFAYDVVLAPLQYLLPAAAGANLTTTSGAVVTFSSPVSPTSSTSTTPSATAAPHPARPDARHSPGRLGALAEGSLVRFRLDGSDRVGTTYAEEIQPVGAKVVARFSTGRPADRTAFTSHHDGAGVGYYVATLPDDDGMQAITRHVFASAGVRGVLPGAQPDVEAIRAGKHLVLISHSERHHAVTLDSDHLLDDLPVTELELPPYGYAVARSAPDVSRSAADCRRHVPAQADALTHRAPIDSQPWSAALSRWDSWGETSRRTSAPSDHRRDRSQVCCCL